MEKTVEKYIKENVARRYALVSSETIQAIQDSGNTVIGDGLAASCHVLGAKMPTNAVFISNTIASMYNGEVVSFEYLLKVLKINLKTLKASFEELKKADLNLILIGYGGYSINTLEFLYQIAVRLGITDLFKTLTIFEDDNLTYTNCLRMYPDMTKSASIDNAMPKLSLIDRDHKYDGVLSSKIILHRTKLTKDDFETRLKGKRVVFLGAPDFDTRKFLEDGEANFIFGGHSGDEVSLINRPHVNADITVETYGTINPTTLFMNLIYAASKLPEALLNSSAPNTEMLCFNFKTFMNGKKSKDLDFLLNLERIGVQLWLGIKQARIY